MCQCGTLLSPRDIPCPHCGSNLRNITVIVNEIVRIVELGRAIKEWYVELTEWVHTLTNIFFKSSEILLSYYLDLVESNLTYLPLFGLDLWLNNTQFRIPRRQVINLKAYIRILT